MNNDKKKQIKIKYPKCNDFYPSFHNMQWLYMFMCFQRCRYSSCNCEKSEDCLCAVFSSYARACAAKGIILEGWRKIVCGKMVENVNECIRGKFRWTKHQKYFKSLLSLLTFCFWLKIVWLFVICLTFFTWTKKCIYNFVQCTIFPLHYCSVKLL